MAVDTFFSHKNFRWLWIHLGLMVGLVVMYYATHPVGGRNGGTPLGYTYGIFGALGIVYLMWFGIRKRSYRNSKGTLKDWLAVHVWLGLALVIVVPLHSGFSFGFNIHSLAYYLMVCTVVSGVWGAINYSRIPTSVGSHRGKGTVKEFLQQLMIIEQDLQAVLRERSDSFLKLYNQINFVCHPTLWNCLRFRAMPELDRKEAASLLLELPSEERETGLTLVSLVNRKRELNNLIAREVRALAALKLWLYVHVPLAFGCVAALCIHIIAVFYFH